MPPRFPPGTTRVGASSPFLTSVTLREDKVTPGVYPFTVPVLEHGFALTFATPVTFLVGENGSGKSTILEALAWRAGFGVHGGSRDHQFAEGVDGQALGRALVMSWRRRLTNGFFLRAETFFNFASYLEAAGSTFTAYGGASLHTKSHGEAFLALFQNRFEDGFYVLDEPEAALSPQRQLAFLRILHQLSASGIAQFVIATHSPMLLALPGATVLSLDDGLIRPIDYHDTEHFRLTRDFLQAPERFFRHLLDEPDSDSSGAT